MSKQYLMPTIMWALQRLTSPFAFVRTTLMLAFYGAVFFSWWLRHQSKVAPHRMPQRVSMEFEVFQFVRRSTSFSGCFRIWRSSSGIITWRLQPFSLLWFCSSLCWKQSDAPVSVRRTSEKVTQFAFSGSRSSRLLPNVSVRSSFTPWLPFHCRWFRRYQYQSIVLYSNSSWSLALCNLAAITPNAPVCSQFLVTSISPTTLTRDPNFTDRRAFTSSLGFYDNGFLQLVAVAPQRQLIQFRNRGAAYSFHGSRSFRYTNFAGFPIRIYGIAKIALTSISVALRITTLSQDTFPSYMTFAKWRKTDASSSNSMNVSSAIR